MTAPVAGRLMVMTIVSLVVSIALLMGGFREVGAWLLFGAVAVDVTVAVAKG